MRASHHWRRFALKVFFEVIKIIELIFYLPVINQKLTTLQIQTTNE